MNAITATTTAPGSATTTAARAQDGAVAGTAPAADLPVAPAVVADLSSGAVALLRSGLAGQAGGADGPDAFRTMVQERTEALAGRLAERFERAGIRLDDPIAMRVDRYGTIRVEGPQQAKIEKLMREDPELAKEFRTVATLNAMQATADMLRLHGEEMRKARTQDERREADARYTARVSTLNDVAGSMTLKEGRLVSAAAVYAQSLSDVPADGKEIAARIADQKTDFLV